MAANIEHSGPSSDIDELCDYCGEDLDRDTCTQNGEKYHKHCLECEIPWCKAAIETFSKYFIGEGNNLYIGFHVNYLYGKATEDARYRKSKKKKRDHKLRELLKKVSALRNSNKGRIFIHIVGLARGDHNTWAFDEFADYKLKDLIHDGSQFNDVYKKQFLGKSEDLAEYYNILLLSVEGGSFVTTSNFRTKVSLDDGIVDHDPVGLKSFLQKRKPFHENFPTANFDHTDLLTLTENRSVQFKSAFLPNDKDDDIIKRVFNQRLTEYISAFTKLDEGGSYYFGLHEETIVPGGASYNSKCVRVQAFPVKNRKAVHDGIRKKVYDSVLVCDYSGKERKDIDIVCLTFIPCRVNENSNVHPKLRDFAPNHRSKDRFVIRISMKPVSGVVFFDKLGPEAYRLEDNRIVRYTVEEWFRDFLRNQQRILKQEEAVFVLRSNDFRRPPLKQIGNSVFDIRKHYRTDGITVVPSSLPAPLDDFREKLLKVFKCQGSIAETMSPYKKPEKDEGFMFLSKTLSVTLDIDTAGCPDTVICDAVIALPNTPLSLLTFVETDRTSDHVRIYNSALAGGLANILRRFVDEPVNPLYGVMTKSDLCNTAIFQNLWGIFQNHASLFVTAKSLSMTPQKYEKVLLAFWAGVAESKSLPTESTEAEMKYLRFLTKDQCIVLVENINNREVHVSSQPGCGATTVMLEVAKRLTRLGSTILVCESEEERERLRPMYTNTAASTDLTDVDLSKFTNVVDETGRVEPGAVHGRLWRFTKGSTEPLQQTSPTLTLKESIPWQEEKEFILKSNDFRRPPLKQIRNSVFEISKHYRTDGITVLPSTLPLLLVNIKYKLLRVLRYYGSLVRTTTGYHTTESDEVFLFLSRALSLVLATGTEGQQGTVICDAVVALPYTSLIVLTFVEADRYSDHVRMYNTSVANELTKTLCRFMDEPVNPVYGVMTKADLSDTVTFHVQLEKIQNHASLFSTAKSLSMNPQKFDKLLLAFWAGVAETKSLPTDTRGDGVAYLRFLTKEQCIVLVENINNKEVNVCSKTGCGATTLMLEVTRRLMRLGKTLLVCESGEKRDRLRSMYSNTIASSELNEVDLSGFTNVVDETGMVHPGTISGRLWRFAKDLNCMESVQWKSAAESLMVKVTKDDEREFILKSNDFQRPPLRQIGESVFRLKEHFSNNGINIIPSQIVDPLAEVKTQLLGLLSDQRLTVYDSSGEITFTTMAEGVVFLTESLALVFDIIISGRPNTMICDALIASSSQSILVLTIVDSDNNPDNARIYNASVASGLANTLRRFMDEPVNPVYGVICCSDLSDIVTFQSALEKLFNHATLFVTTKTLSMNQQKFQKVLLALWAGVAQIRSLPIDSGRTGADYLRFLTKEQCVTLVENINNKEVRVISHPGCGATTLMLEVSRRLCRLGDTLLVCRSEHECDRLKCLYSNTIAVTDLSTVDLAKYMNVVDETGTVTKVTDRLWQFTQGNTREQEATYRERLTYLPDGTLYLTRGTVTRNNLTSMDETEALTEVLEDTPPARRGKPFTREIQQALFTITQYEQAIKDGKAVDTKDVRGVLSEVRNWFHLLEKEYINTERLLQALTSDARQETMKYLMWEVDTLALLDLKIRKPDTSLLTPVLMEPGLMEVSPNKKRSAGSGRNPHYRADLLYGVMDGFKQGIQEQQVHKGRDLFPLLQNATIGDKRRIHYLQDMTDFFDADTVQEEPSGDAVKGFIDWWMKPGNGDEVEGFIDWWPLSDSDSEEESVSISEEEETVSVSTDQPVVTRAKHRNIVRRKLSEMYQKIQKAKGQSVKLQPKKGQKGEMVHKKPKQRNVVMRNLSFMFGKLQRVVRRDKKTSPKIDLQTTSAETFPADIRFVTYQNINGPDSDAVTGPDRDAVKGTDSDVVMGPDSDAVAGSDRDAVTGSDSDALMGPDSDAVMGSDSDAVTGSDSDAVAGSGRDAVMGPDRDAVTGPDNDAVTGPDRDAVMGPDSDAVTGSGSDVVTGSDRDAVMGPDRYDVTGSDSDAVMGPDSDAVMGSHSDAVTPQVRENMMEPGRGELMIADIQKLVEPGSHEDLDPSTDEDIGQWVEKISIWAGEKELEEIAQVKNIVRDIQEKNDSQELELNSKDCRQEWDYNIAYLSSQISNMAIKEAVTDIIGDELLPVPVLEQEEHPQAVEKTCEPLVHRLRQFQYGSLRHRDMFGILENIIREDMTVNQQVFREKKAILDLDTGCPVYIIGDNGSPHSGPMLCPVMKLDKSRVNTDTCHVSTDGGTLVNRRDRGQYNTDSGQYNTDSGQYNTDMFRRYYGTCSSPPIPLPPSPSTLTAPRYWESHSRLSVTGWVYGWTLLEMGICGVGEVDTRRWVSVQTRSSWAVSVVECDTHRDRYCTQVWGEGRQVGGCYNTKSITHFTTVVYKYGVVLDVERGRVAFLDLDRDIVIEKMDVRITQPLRAMFGVTPLSYYDIQMRLVSGGEIAMTDNKQSLIYKALSV